MKRILFFALLLPALLFDVNTFASKRHMAHRLADSLFKVANIFQSNMIIQQEKPFAIWGKATAGSAITIKSDWSGNAVSVVAGSDNTWRAEVKVPKAVPGDFNPHTLTVSEKDTAAAFTNLLIGDVWLASGQSNMQFSMEDKDKKNGVLDFESEVAAANYPNIRWFYTDLNFKAQPYDQVTGHWEACSPATVGHFSAVAYYFARSVYQHVNIPIGIVLSNIGASTGQAWTSRKELESDTILYNRYLRDYDNSPKSKEVINSGFTFEKVTRPTLLYNAMIHPLAGLSIKGILWYQGEFNRNDAGKYTLLLSHMIEGWRSDFRQGNVPFYLVQVPPFYWNNEDPTAFDYAIFREAQTNIRKAEPNTEMAVTIDDDEARNLHPRNKKPVGERLAMIALNKDYGFKDIAYIGPQVASLKMSGKKVKITYTKQSVAGGLKTSDDKPPRLFFVAGDDHVFYPAEATIKGDKVVLESDIVKDVKAVRYAFTNTSVTNFMNSAGLPAEPFRTDAWNEQKDTKKIKVDYEKLNKSQEPAKNQ
jgi:sialate O-acetylesterase